MLVVIAGLLLWKGLPADACMETAWSEGYLSADVTIETVTLASGSGSSCSCCALCHQNAACASFSYQAYSGQCQLYSTVADYQTLVINPSLNYFVMPGRSQHHQFCREDSDCQMEGDFCRGRVCTDLTAVTCRVIYEAFQASTRFGQWPVMHGWLSNQSQIFNCLMTDKHPGFTRLLRNNQGFVFTAGTIGRYGDADPNGATSILDLAEDIRQLRTEPPTYQLLLTGWGLQVLFGNVSRSEPVMTATPRDSPLGKLVYIDRDPSLQAVAMPYRPPQAAGAPPGSDLLAVRVWTSSTWPELRSLARTDGVLWGGRTPNVALFIRE